MITRKGVPLPEVKRLINNEMVESANKISSCQNHVLIRKYKLMYYVNRLPIGSIKVAHIFLL